MLQSCLVLTGCVLLMASCDLSGVKNNQKKQDALQHPKSQDVLKDQSLKPIPAQQIKYIEQGIRITWYAHGKGESLKDGMVAKINYEVLLMDSSYVDGNKLLKRPWLPFLVGYGMQTPGWDIALKHLRVGDFAEIYLPAKMARGENGIKGLIPPNSPNVIRIKILDVMPPTRVVDGTKIWLLEENKSQQKKATLEDEVEFHYMVGTQSNPKYDISYTRAQPYVLRFSDFGIVKGLKKALINAKKADKLWILVPPSEAYGNKGLMDLVKPNEHVFYDIFVMDVR